MTTAMNLSAAATPIRRMLTDSRPASFIDSRDLRNVLGRFPTGVAVITARLAGDEPVGLTVNSFASVSLDPALVLWSLAKRSSSLAAFEACGAFAIHFLNEHQTGLAERFASKVEDRFAGLQVSSGMTGVPLIQSCAARIECATRTVLDGGDHKIFIGEVVCLEESDPSVLPLVFHRGAFAKLQ